MRAFQSLSSIQLNHHLCSAIVLVSEAHRAGWESELSVPCHGTFLREIRLCFLLHHLKKPSSEEAKIHTTSDYHHQCSWLNGVGPLFLRIACSMNQFEMLRCFGLFSATSSSRIQQRCSECRSEDTSVMLAALKASFVYSRL